MPRGTLPTTLHATAALLTVLLVGCADSPGGSPSRSAAAPSKSATQKVSYQPPRTARTVRGGVTISQPISEVERQLAANVAAIKGADFAPGRSGELFVVRYSGNPRDFIDCGTLSLQGRAASSAKEVRAAEDKVQLPRTSRYPDGRLERKVRLDSRTTLRLTELPGGGTLIDDNTRYVVTKEINAFAFGGGKDGKDKWLGRTRETVAFDTDEAGSFKAGTTCVATGRLEQALVQGLTGPVAVEPMPAPAVVDPSVPAPAPAPNPTPGAPLPGLF